MRNIYADWLGENFTPDEQWLLLLVFIFGVMLFFCVLERRENNKARLEAHILRETLSAFEQDYEELANLLCDFNKKTDDEIAAIQLQIMLGRILFYRKFGFTRSAIAERLGITKGKLQYACEKYGITNKRWYL